MRNLFKRAKPFKAVLSLKVDFSSDMQKNYGDLEPGQSYFLGKREQKITYDEIKDFLIETVEIDLKKNLEKITDYQIISINVVNEYSGSIELVLTIVFGTFSVLSGIKGLYDSITLNKNQSRKFISRRLKTKYGLDFNVDTNVEYPTIERYYLEDLFFHFGKRGILPFPVNTSEGIKSNRDGFFYYLLISNVVLLIILGLMVYKAVIQQFGW
jgi:hypothetical protein